MERLQVNARDLGRILMEDFCPRCFWLSSKCPVRTPSPFAVPLPGIVSTLDAYIKRVVTSTFNEKGQLPDWLANEIGALTIKQVLKPEKWRVEVEGTVLVGEPDALWQLDDGSLFIADFKVAKITSAQEKLFPLYSAQLKAYGFLAEKTGHAVRELALIYLEPLGYSDDPEKAVAISAEQLTLHFGCHVKRVEKGSSEEVEGLVRQVREILLQPTLPKGRDGCGGCRELLKWFADLRSILQT